MTSPRAYDVLVHRPYPWMERSRLVGRLVVDVGDLPPVSEAAAELVVRAAERELGLRLAEGQVAVVRPVA